MILMLVLGLAGAVAVPSAASAARVRTEGATKRVVDFRVSAKRGQVCTVTVRRGTAKRTRQIDLGMLARGFGRVRLSGAAKPRYSVRCGFPGTGLKPGQTAMVTTEKRGNFPTRVAIYRGGSFSRPYRKLLDREVRELFSGWSFVTIDPRWRDTYSADFTKVTFQGMRTGDAGYHVGVLDLRRLRVTDLTERRQKTGSSDPVLCERNPAFAVAPGPRFTYSSTQVTFTLGTGAAIGELCPTQPGTGVVSLGAPGAAAAWSAPPAAFMEARLGAPEARPSADGAFVYHEIATTSGRDLSVFRAADGTEHAVTCAGLADALPLGWVDARTFAVSDDHDFRLVHVGGDGAATCDGGVPPAQRDVHHILLSPDRSAIGFKATGSSGDDFFSLPIGSTAPVEIAEPALIALAPDDFDISDQSVEFEVGPR